MARSHSSGLSKSLILKGLQCRKALWLTRNPPAFELPPQPARDALFSAGAEVGILARQLYPGGREVPFEGLSIPAQLARTKELLASDVEVIYEAAFSFSAIFIKVDILVRDGESWQLHEVKMSSAVKPVHLDDVAVQHYVLSGCGIKISKAVLIHLDSSYCRGEELEIGRLFHSEEITAKVRARQQSLPEIVVECRQTLGEYREPAISIGPHCTDPYQCEFIPYCWRQVPTPSVFDLPGDTADKFAFYRRGLSSFAELPLAELEPRQRQQVEAFNNRTRHVDQQRLEEFLANIRYPLCYLDLTGVSTALPLFADTRPYQPLPFLFAIHRQLSPDDPPEQVSFLAEPGRDPRYRLARELLAAIPANACVLTCHPARVSALLGSLTGRYPELTAAIEQRLANLQDLLTPFRNRWINDWRMGSAATLSAVLPALGIDQLAPAAFLSEAGAAQRAYLACQANTDPAQQKQLQRDLLDYAEQNSLTMVRVLQELRNLAEC